MPAVLARAVWKAVATETLLYSTQVMFASAWGTLLSLVADLEDFLSWLQVGINKRNCWKVGGKQCWRKLSQNPRMIWVGKDLKNPSGYNTFL